jgi:hypothetical protein
MVYWGVCMLVAVAIPVVAYVEAKETILQVNRERKAAYRETILAEPGGSTEASDTDA